MSLVSVSEFLARFDRQYVADLVTRDGETPEDVEAEIGTRVALALEDAEAELDGYRPRIAEDRWPSDATRATHITKVTVYLLSLDRPGKEFEQIRNAYVDTIEFYKGLLPVDSSTATPPLGVTHCAPHAQFTDAGFRGFGNG